MDDPVLRFDVGQGQDCVTYPHASLLKSNGNGFALNRLPGRLVQELCEGGMASGEDMIVKYFSQHVLVFRLHQVGESAYWQFGKRVVCRGEYCEGSIFDSVDHSGRRQDHNKR